jgi:tetratricopeptide (TPR) repeat protein
MEYQKFDSAAMYFEIAADLKKDEDSWIKAGNAYYEAFTFAIDPEESKYYGTKVRECFGAILETDPDRLDLKTKMGMTLVSSSNPMQGITMLREVLEKDPDNEEALYNLGILAFQTGQFAVAVSRFEKLVQAHQDNVQGHFYLGLSYMELKEFAKAKEQLEVVKDLDKSPEVQATVDSYLEEINK